MRTKIKINYIHSNGELNFVSFYNYYFTEGKKNIKININLFFKFLYAPLFLCLSLLSLIENVITFHFEIFIF